VNAAAFAAMKPEAIFVDVSRGGVVDGGALIDAMQNRAIAGAALDVFEKEPLSGDSPIWGLENVLVSPHCSSIYAEWGMQAFELFLDNLRGYRAGKPLFNVIDPDRGY
jgi:phosphoglycerate dehydrogenase-like enzyme